MWKRASAQIQSSSSRDNYYWKLVTHKLGWAFELRNWSQNYHQRWDCENVAPELVSVPENAEQSKILLFGHSDWRWSEDLSGERWRHHYEQHQSIEKVAASWTCWKWSWQRKTISYSLRGNHEQGMPSHVLDLILPDCWPFRRCIYVAQQSASR